MPRQVYRKRSVSLANFLGSTGLGITVGFLFWRDWDPRMFFVTGFFVMFIECGILLRRRLEAACPHCAFDPIIYKRSPERACALVKEHLEKRASDPAVWLAQKPNLNLPVRHVKGKDTAEKSSTQELSV